MAVPAVTPPITPGRDPAANGGLRLAQTTPLNYPECLPGAFRGVAELYRAAGDKNAEAAALTTLVGISGSIGIQVRLNAAQGRVGIPLVEPGHVGLDFSFTCTPLLTEPNRELLASAAGHQIRSGPLPSAGAEVCLGTLLFDPKTATAQKALDTLLANENSASRLGPPLGRENDVVSILYRRSGGMPVHMVIRSRDAANELRNANAEPDSRIKNLSILLADKVFGPCGIASVWQKLTTDEKARALNVLALAPASEFIGAVFARALFDSNAFVVSTAISGLFRAPRHLDQYAAAGALAIASGPYGASRSMAFSLLTTKLAASTMRMPVLVSLACIGDLQPAEAIMVSAAIGRPAHWVAERAEAMYLPPPNLDRAETAVNGDEAVHYSGPRFEVTFPSRARRNAA